MLLKVPQKGMIIRIVLEFQDEMINYWSEKHKHLLLRRKVHEKTKNGVLQNTNEEHHRSIKEIDTFHTIDLNNPQWRRDQLILVQADLIMDYRYL